jgi:hypothetical protein
LFKQRPADQRGLMMAICTLIQVAGLDNTLAPTTTVRTLKTGWPSRLK